MTLSASTNLGTYEIVSPLGAGGMGEVYRARDIKLDRDVAIKVLPEALSQDKELLARFQREAKLLAQLNHANIATLHGLEEFEGRTFLVMELVEGETLAEQIARGPIPPDEARPLFIQIAEGLEAAHEKGIIHRDLKPANIKTTPDGTVKILDFGLAKAFTANEDVSAETSQSPTMTKGTALGTIMGTASYMSPEQARGKPVDKRTDIWAFGCCLYEALTGKKAFAEETVTDTISAVVRAEPDWKSLSKHSAQLRRLLARCLRKDHKVRLRDIGDARLEIGEPDSEPATLPNRDRKRYVHLLPWALVAALAVMLSLLGRDEGGTANSKMVRQFKLNLPELLPITTVFTLSRDGRYLAYAGRRYGETVKLFLHDLQAGTVRDLDGTEGADFPFFSPNGLSIGFFAAEKLRKVTFDGGPSLPICDVADGFGGSWTEAGEMIFGTPSSGLFRVPDSGGSPVPLTVPPAEAEGISHRWPHVLPGDEGVFFTIWNAGDNEGGIGWASLASGETTVVMRSGTSPRFVNDSYLVYARDEALMGVRFDLESGSALGEPTPLTKKVFTGLIGFGAFEVSEDGMLVFSSTTSWQDASVVRVNRNGNEEVVLSKPGQSYRQPKVSPSGTHMAVSHSYADNPSISNFDLERRTLSPVITGVARWPVWTPDGRRITFVGSRAGQWNVLSATADGRGAPEPLIALHEMRQLPTSYSPSGVLAFERGSMGARDIWFLDPTTDPNTRPFLATEANERGAAFSPDGDWIAFTSDRSGRDEVYVASVSGTGDVIPISNDGGREPVWARAGNELFYRNGRRLMVVPVSIGATLEPGIPKLLFEGKYSYGHVDWSFNYDVSPDGKHFYMVKESDELEHRFNVVTNWTEELKRLIPRGH